MADAKLTALTADASPTTDDLIYVVNDPGGTPASRKVTIANLAALLFASPTFTGSVSGASANFSSTCSAAAVHATGLVSGASASFSATCAAAALNISGNIVNGSTTYTAGAASQVGYLGVPINSKSAAYEFVAADAGQVVLHATADNNARTFTIPSSATVAFAIGTVLTVINMKNTVTIAITTDTMTLANSASTGSRTLAVNGFATAVKVETGNWIINGTGLT